MRVAAVTGLSGSGKTTLLEELIRLYVARGERVAAIKHTHHALNDENRGDTARFRTAGADPVILAGGRAAVIHTGQASARLTFGHPLDLLPHTGADVVFIEGFKYFTAWLRIEVVRGEWRNADTIAAALDSIWNHS